MTREQLEDWVARYERAWRTAGTAGLSELFTPRASYRMHPYGDVEEGLEAICALWERERDGADEVFALEADVMAVEADVGVVRAHIAYGDPVGQEYRELWVVHFDEQGRCVEFEEWPHWPPGTNGDATPSSRQAG